MKLSKARECYESHTRSASGVCRQIAFAGIAVVWVFNKPVQGSVIELPPQLLVVLLWLCITLACDLLQYTFASLVWGFYSRRKEKQLTHQFHNDPDIEPPAYLNWPALIMFWGKLGSLIMAYAALARYLFRILAA